MNQTYYESGMTATAGGNVLMSIASIAASLLSFYSLLIWLRIILTWIRVPGQTRENPLAYYIGKIVDPYLSWFRGISSLRRSHIDLTPLVALAVLSVVQSMLRLYGAYGTITVGMVVALILQTLWSYLVSPIFWFLIILLGIRLFLCYKRSAKTISYITMLDSLIGGVLNWVQRIFYHKRAINDRQLVTTALVFFIVLYIAASFALRFLLNFFGTLSF
ncbi:YggT family protein [Sphaerochaeta halotolerans]|jgi:YggT family protein|uniref:YggT family protein n=1 Tax=Sphaerochaeta halotolerans TaxID=2293840 RepID=A0A372MGB4_9SPIR|nr:YggT family protein [Sphaerochaeta halotolerans]MBG0766924.1 YggT family protein [Spirochaetaceae bacterium]MDK2859690.1 YggT family protein [Sphaerochaeta sp.]MDN5333864.1 YggT family protein [Sphaerochaeta sp.]MXI87327.1 YggT family protein [Sphaerochaeta halotolerans]RFU94230.1 YggT family protein [Sphaerochaeta halotolerans]